MFYVLRFLWKRKIKYFFYIYFHKQILRFFSFILRLRSVSHFTIYFTLFYFTFIYVFLCLRLFTFINKFHVFVYETEHKHKNHILILRLRFFYENVKKKRKISTIVK